MKIIILFVFFAINARADMTPAQINKFADCVYKIEGGNKTKYFYGVKSIPYPKNSKLNKEIWARNITLNSIKLNYTRWSDSGKTNSFQNFYANRWCPAISDSIGNKNWRKNINKLFPDAIK